jgi:hypothetical protein
MEKGWMISFPLQGTWHHITNLISAGEVYQYAKDHFITHEIEVQTVCGQDFRKWLINSQQKITTFWWYLKNSLGTGELKLRMKVRER